jgi:hypothetical protein
MTILRTKMAKASGKFKKQKEAAAKAKKELEKAAKAAFREASAEVFAGNPQIVSFGWSQYTPYWNDGDACVFGANTGYPVVTFKAKDGKVVRYDEDAGEIAEVGTAAAEGGVEYSEDSGLDFEVYRKEADKYSKAVADFLGDFGEDDLETMFGDHVLVTVTPKKVETEEYEHE